MILAFDTYYFNNKAKTVCLAFADWTDDAPHQIYSETLEDVEDYTPGEFYRRELPCILSLLKQVHFPDVEAIVIDGFVYLDDSGKLGLGGHLYQALDGQVPVIGVAKTNFATIETCKKPLLRGKSTRPLYITAIGVDIDDATENIRRMSGDFRIPALLKQLDGLTKEKPDAV
ncbi:MAG: endonuclease V [Cytophagales bacterium]|jgi:exodeoxyribonuclease-5/deoxyribonuclease V|nr:endonuclease V [Cytophagales bacterium]